MQRSRSTFAVASTLAIAALVAACGGSPAVTPTAAPPTVAQATVAPPSDAPATTVPASNPATGPANLEAPASVEAGRQFDVTWTGPNGDRDYVTIVAPGATEWTEEPFFYTASGGNPGQLTAPAAAGSYVLWYVQGTDEQVLFRRDIAVTPFQGSLLAPETVIAGTEFEVAWNGPDGPGDYVTIVAQGATKWTNEPYFYTASGGNPATLQAPIEDGAYEIWYVLGAAETIEARVPIVVTAFSASVDGPDEASKGSSVDVTWTGPDGPGDYITFAPVGSPEGTYLAYCYTYVGSPCAITAPDDAGPFEIRYVTQAGKTLASAPIVIK